MEILKYKNWSDKSGQFLYVVCHLNKQILIKYYSEVLGGKEIT